MNYIDVIGLLIALSGYLMLLIVIKKFVKKNYPIMDFRCKPLPHILFGIGLLLLVLGCAELVEVKNLAKEAVTLPLKVEKLKLEEKYEKEKKELRSKIATLKRNSDAKARKKIIKLKKKLKNLKENHQKKLDGMKNQETPFAEGSG